MRSLAEIQFRLRQEVANAWLLWRQPTFRNRRPNKIELPDAQKVATAVQRTTYAELVEAIAGQVLNHTFPILGVEVSTGKEISWRRDYLHSKASEIAYFKRIPYLNFDAVGDHKLVWELNRHQHLVVLAQAYRLTYKQEYVDEIATELVSWTQQNPFQKGINWASALEVAFRALSWVWVYHLVGEELSVELQELLVSGLYQHGLHLAENLSVYFSPNTHLLGEAVALFTIGALFPEFPHSKRWIQVGRRIVLEQARAQVQNDGSHFEQSTYYHIYAVDFFVFFYLIAGRPSELTPVIERMAEYVAWLLGPSREIEFYGDDDGGRFFFPYGARNRFGRATLSTCGVVLDRPEWVGTKEDLAEQAVWWLGADCLSGSNPDPGVMIGTRRFPDCGTVFLEAGAFHLQMDCGPFGFGGAGHSHSDTLSLTLRYQGKPVFIDPGTYTYISDVDARNWFRGSGAHNTICIDHLDQAQSVGPFRWADKPKVELSQVSETRQGQFVDANCTYRGLAHRRRVLLTEERLLVLDTVIGPGGEHSCEQIWQLGPAASLLHLSTSSPNATGRSAFSPAYGCKLDGTCLIASWQGELPASLVMRLSIHDQGTAASVEEAETIFAEIG